MATKIIRAVFGNQKSIVTVSRMQYDYGQVIDVVDVNLPATFEARFSNQPTGESVRVIGENQQVAVPDELLENAGFVWCYITVHDEVTDGRTMYTMRIPIKPASERTDAEPTPVQQDIITQAIAMVNTAVDTTSQKAQEASDSADRAEQAAEGIEAYVERAEAAQSASEDARDIALEAKVSAQASAATATEKASEAISSATTASQSALTAENASESAQEYATASAESALRAIQKALEAAQSATNAQTYASNAESAKTASETAQAASETARDGAVTAKEDAESARSEAQDIVDGISGKVEQIDSNTERIESLEDDRYKPYPTDTASGSVASFPDGADNIPLKSCIVQVEPVQEGSGDPSPDNVRPISGFTGCEVKHSGEDTSNPTTYPITFPAEAGTVYGAYVDVLNGELVVDRAELSITTVGGKSGTWETSAGNGSYYYIGGMPIISRTNDGVIVDRLATTGGVNLLSPVGKLCFYGTGIIRWTDSDEAMQMELDNYRAYLAEHPIKLTYRLTEPIHYPIISNQINSLYGQNNIWANTGDTEVEYRADVTKYISKKITEAVSALT